MLAHVGKIKANYAHDLLGTYTYMFVKVFFINKARFSEKSFEKNKNQYSNIVFRSFRGNIIVIYN